ncbi:hypothetical protein LCGC14_2518400 [marine sediment metagenome]|uniref:Transglycosylase SLT domain-containing protein n=1 Tax=marine sediment metagenome TaxID=412755 RepID=A0A0F9BK27_9ZZZZ
MSMPEGLSKDRVDAVRVGRGAASWVEDGWTVQGSHGQMLTGGRAAEDQVGLADARLTSLGAHSVPLAPLPVVPVSPTSEAEAPSHNSSNEGGASPRDGGIRDAFFDGYRSAGGQDDARIDALIWCESSWRLDPGGAHLGLSQFDPGTWATVSAITGYTDWRDPFSQGYATATWASMVDPGTSAGWPTCWGAW